jgi:hypothetical protein
MPIEQISRRSRITDFEKFERKIDSYGKTGKGTPIHAKGSIYFNQMLKHFNLEAKYEAISSGVKVKWVYLAKNQFNFEMMAFIDVFPSELAQHFKINYKKMFDKSVVPPVERLYDSIGWDMPQITSATTTNLFELFS